jgi:hypothetical protein
MHRFLLASSAVISFDANGPRLSCTSGGTSIAPTKRLGAHQNKAKTTHSEGGPSSRQMHGD